MNRTASRKRLPGLFLMLLVLTMGLVPTNATANAAKPDLRISERLHLARVLPLAAERAVPVNGLQLSTSISGSIARDLVLSHGQRLIGTDYLLGSNTDEAVDCSSLVQQVFRSAGLSLPRTARELTHVGEAVAATDLQPGDLVFYRWGPSGLHVAIYMAGNRILHASSSRREVVVTALNQSWNRRMVGARRLL